MWGVLLACALGAGLEAPPPALLASGAHVRVGRPDAVQFLAEVLEADEGSMLLRPLHAREPVRLWYAELGSLEVRNGLRRRGREGAWLGLAAALVLTGAIEDLVMNEDLARAFRVGAGGAVVGYAVGLFVKTERWDPIPVGLPRVTVHPVPRGAAVRVAFSW